MSRHAGVFNNGTYEENVKYLHVHHPHFGDYAHLILRNVSAENIKPLKNFWDKNIPVVITFEFEDLRNEPTPHSVGIYKEYSLLKVE